MRVPSFFMHGTPAAYAEQGERSAALPVEKWRELELRVMHSRDVELMASVVRKRNLRVAGSRAGSAVLVRRCGKRLQSEGLPWC